MTDPAKRPSRLLLAVVGLTPQVVTETLYALIVARKPPFRPNRLHLITTSEGAERIRLLLLDPEEGWLGRFVRDYAPDLAPELAPPFRGVTLDVLRGPDGEMLADISTAEEGIAAADQILAAVRDATADPDGAVWGSIAGGRKTMGFLLGYALSLYGRPQDRLSHVLVNPPFQDHPEFFYPPPRPRTLFVMPGNRPVRTDAARIVLTDIPFVRLRGRLPSRLLEGRIRFAEVVEEVQAALGADPLVLDVRRHCLLWRDRVIRLPPADFAFVLWLARRRLNGQGALHWSELRPEAYLELYQSLGPHGARHLERVRQRLLGKDADLQAWFNERVAHINKIVDNALGEVAGLYRIRRQGHRPHTRYELAAERIEIRE